ELARAREEYVQTSRLSPTTDHEIAFKMLRTARRPVLMLDRRALLQNPPHPILSLAEEMHAPILLTTAATCAPPTIVQRWIQLAGDRVLFLPANNIVWLRAFMKADLLLTLGARLRESEGFGLNDFHLTRADIVQVHPGSFQTDPNVKLFINNLAADFAENMLTLLRRMRPDESEPVLDYRLTNLRIKRLESIRHETVQLHKGLERAAESAHQNQPLDPAAVTHAIVGRSAAETLFIGEGNSTGMWMWSYLWLRPVLYPDLMASIGLALPWTMGVLQSADRRPIRVFLGDGSFLYQSGFLPELSGGGKDVTVFLYNNAAWSSIRLEQTFVFRGRYPGTELPQVDYTRIAQLHGWDTMRVESMEDLQAALNRADESGKKRPFFVDINLPRDSIPFAGIMFALAELDYIARPMLSRVTRSALRAMLRRKVPYRFIGMVLRILFS
ncbi:MAG: thiamine pyrophosphate-binding protein, partial [Leptospiraceae bacterium]|nr:thiamine pyrophosphate-binding protein [Leptospiraceae bacterium]